MHADACPCVGVPPCAYTPATHRLRVRPRRLVMTFRLSLPLPTRRPSFRDVNRRRKESVAPWQCAALGGMCAGRYLGRQRNHLPNCDGCAASARGACQGAQGSRRHTYHLTTTSLLCHPPHRPLPSIASPPHILPAHHPRTQLPWRLSSPSLCPDSSIASP